MRDIVVRFNVWVGLDFSLGRIVLKGILGIIEEIWIWIRLLDKIKILIYKGKDY